MTVNDAVAHLGEITKLAEGEDKEALLLVVAALRLVTSENKHLKANLRMLEESP